MKQVLRHTIFIFLFALAGKSGISQNLQKLDSVYQYILNDPKFVSEILKDSSFLCDRNLYFLPINNDSIFTGLTFQNKEILHVNQIGKRKCACITTRFKLYRKDSYRLKIIIEKPVGQSGACVFYETVYYMCILKKNKDSWEIQNREIGSGRSQAKFM